MIVEPAVADSITGSEFNPYIFRTARNSSQDAYAAAAAIAGEGVKIATFAPDYSFGWDGVAAFKAAAEGLGAEIVLEEYADPAATDFTSNLQKIIDAKPDFLFVVWAGANSPWNQIADLCAPTTMWSAATRVCSGSPRSRRCVSCSRRPSGSSKVCTSTPFTLPGSFMCRSCLPASTRSRSSESSSASRSRVRRR